MKKLIEQLTEISNEVLIESGREPVGLLRREMDLRKDLDFDSLDLAILTVKIEALFSVDVFEKGLVRTVGEIVSQLEVRRDG